MDPRVTEFHCIMPLVNIHSVMQYGILSYDRASKLPHHSVAMQPVQERRDEKQVPGGLKLHRYANLYFDARNPMMYKRKDEANDLCVLKISVGVLELSGTVITDCNAASNYVRYLAPSQTDVLDFDDIYALDWRHPNSPGRYYQHKSRKCAEVLVPHGVPPKYIEGAYVVDRDAITRLAALGFHAAIEINVTLFFR